MTSDDRMTWGLILEVLDVLERHGYHSRDHQHTGQAVGVISGLARVYDGTQDTYPGSYAVQVPDLAQAAVARPGPAAEQDAVTIAPAEAKTLLAALDAAADYKRDRAETCADCADQSCPACESRLQDAQAYDRLAARMLQAAQAEPGRQPGPGGVPRSELHPAADKEAGQ
jgi:hypothetical protein